MKRAIIIFVVAALVLLSIWLWLNNTSVELATMDFLQIGVIVLLVGFAVFVGFKRLSNARRGEPVEDELSKRVLQRAAALSYFISLYIWVFLLFLKDRIQFDTEELLGTGILGMAVTFAVCWLIFNFKGTGNG